MNPRLLAVLVVLAAAVGVGAHGKAKAPKDKPREKDPSEATLQGRMLAPEKISAGVREVLKRKMKGHGKEFQLLAHAVALAEPADAERYAQAIINEPRLDKAAAGDDLSGLGDAFFKLQDQLRDRAAEMQKAAVAKDVRAMTQNLGTLAAACTACHVIYREPAKPAEPATEAGAAKK